MARTPRRAQRPHLKAARGYPDSTEDRKRAWTLKGLCRSQDPDALFASGAAQRAAAVICRHCPVKQQCAAEALDNHIEFGVWGGLTERQRRALLTKNPEVRSWSDFLARSRGGEEPTRAVLRRIG